MKDMRARRYGEMPDAKVAVITGASSGIGAATAELLARSGMSVVLTARRADKLNESDPGIQVSLVSPGVVRTEFGLKAMHGGPDSRQLPNSQSAEEVAPVIAAVIESGAPDVYTLPGAHDRIAGYNAAIGSDPPM